MDGALFLTIRGFAPSPSDYVIPDSLRTLVSLKEKKTTARGLVG